MSLTREDFLSIDDITIKKIVIPSNVPAWGGKELYIKQLNRGQQDVYLKRQFGDTRMKQNETKQQEISQINIYGHDAWLCIKSVCDESGKLLFTNADEDSLNKKSGEAIGWIAAQVVEFSGMKTDDKIAKGEITPEEALAEEIKN
jgi:hypothetical protein